MSLAVVYLPLNARCCLNGAVDARKACEEPITHRLNNSTRPIRDHRLDNLAEKRHQPRMRLGLIGVHQPRIPSHVSKQDRSQLAVHLCQCSQPFGSQG